MTAHKNPADRTHMWEQAASFTAPMPAAPAYPDYPHALPRHLHKDGASQIVHTPAQCDEALEDGWEIHPSTVAPIADVDVDAAPAEMAAGDEPKKKRKR